MKLGDVLDRIMDVKGWNQTLLGLQIGAPQSMVSRMCKGDDWEIHWQVFLKIIPLAVDVGILGARDLLPPDGHGPKGTRRDLESSKTTAPKTGQRKTEINTSGNDRKNLAKKDAS